MGQTNNDVAIPDGVVYKKTTNAINEQAKKAILNELKNSTYTFFDKLLYCGPNFWDHYKSNPKIGAIEKGNIDFQVPQPDGKIIIKNGKLIQNKDDYRIIWEQIVKDFNSPNLTIRKLNTDELKYYWSIIFFDIEEPIFVIENTKLKIILDLNEKSNLLFIEALN